MGRDRRPRGWIEPRRGAAGNSPAFQGLSLPTFPGWVGGARLEDIAGPGRDSLIAIFASCGQGGSYGRIRGFRGGGMG